MSLTRISVTLIVLGAVTSPALAQSDPATSNTTAPQADRADRVTGWRSDLATLGKILATRHKDAFTVTPRERFDAEVATLDARLHALSDIEIVLEMRRLVAMVGDAHTTLGDPHGRYATRVYPISVLLPADGAYITASTPQHSHLLGRRLVRIGDASVEDAIERLGVLVPDENAAWLRNQVRSLMVTPEALAFVGLADRDLRARFTHADAQGGEAVVTLSPMHPGEKQASAPELAPEKLAPTLMPRAGGAIFGAAMLPGSRDLYVWYDACRNAADKPVAQFARETLETIDREKPQRLLVDLRRNGGGNSSLIWPLIAGIAQREEVNTRGRLFVLIGAGTFSSGLWAAQDFKNRTNAVLVGSPTGGKPNSFGEQQSAALPYSGLVLRYSTKRWGRDPKGDPASLEPQILAQPTWAELIAGRDAVIDAVRAYEFRPPPDRR